jgi:hypothetical protein
LGRDGGVFHPQLLRRNIKEEYAVKKFLLAAAAVGGLTALSAFGASAAPVVGAAGHGVAPAQHVVQADYFSHGHHWHHRHYEHGSYRYW